MHIQSHGSQTPQASGALRGDFFLSRPRLTGKSTLLRESYPEAIWYDLLETDRYLRLLERPSLLREELLALGVPRLVVIDEVRKAPPLLDEVHGVMERRGWVFALCGSSARKARRGRANLLDGRALRHELFGLVSTGWQVTACFYAADHRPTSAPSTRNDARLTLAAGRSLQCKCPPVLAEPCSAANDGRDRVVQRASSHIHVPAPSPRRHP